MNGLTPYCNTDLQEFDTRQLIIHFIITRYNSSASDEEQQIFVLVSDIGRYTTNDQLPANIAVPNLCHLTVLIE